MNKLTAENSETSEEIIRAIYCLALDIESEAQRIWEDPTNDELYLIRDRVTGAGRRRTTDYLWGECAEHWFPEEPPI